MPKLIVVLVDTANIGYGLYAVVIYFMNFADIQKMLADIELIRYIVPIVALLDLLALVRMAAFIWLFLILPRVNRRWMVR